MIIVCDIIMFCVYILYCYARCSKLNIFHICYVYHLVCNWRIMLYGIRLYYDVLNNLVYNIDTVIQIAEVYAFNCIKYSIHTFEMENR